MTIRDATTVAESTLLLPFDLYAVAAEVEAATLEREATDVGGEFGDELVAECDRRAAGRGIEREDSSIGGGIFLSHAEGDKGVYCRRIPISSEHVPPNILAERDGTICSSEWIVEVTDRTRASYVWCPNRGLHLVVWTGEPW